MNHDRELYLVAIYLRQILKDIRMRYVWPPTHEAFSRESVKESIPCKLFNFLAWTIGISEEALFDEFVDVEERSESVIISMAQDLIYNANQGKVQTQKHMALGII